MTVASRCSPTGSGRRFARGREPGSARKGKPTATSKGRPAGTVLRRPLHWPLAFPEVFADTPDPGFDAIIGNPPFLGGQKISGTLGATTGLASTLGRHGVQRQCRSRRFLRSAVQACFEPTGQLGYIATNTLVQGDTLEVGLCKRHSCRIWAHHPTGRVDVTSGRATVPIWR